MMRLQLKGIKNLDKKYVKMSHYVNVKAKSWKNIVSLLVSFFESA